MQPLQWAPQLRPHPILLPHSSPSALAGAVGLENEPLHPFWQLQALQQLRRDVAAGGGDVHHQHWACDRGDNSKAALSTASSRLSGPVLPHRTSARLSPLHQSSCAHRLSCLAAAHTCHCCISRAAPTTTLPAPAPAYPPALSPTVQGVEIQPVHACARSVRFGYKVPWAVDMRSCGSLSGSVR